MLLLLIIQLIMLKIMFDIIVLIYNIYYKCKISKLLESVVNKNDLIYMNYKDFVYVVAEIFRRKGYSVVHTDKCGEDNNGLILNDIFFVEVCKYSFYHRMEIESAMKMARRMDSNSISRGMLITLGDFKDNTRKYCYSNVIECINCDKLMQMCRQVQRRSRMFQPN